MNELDDALMACDPDPVVSVIIPTFNRVSYLKEAINSILNQTFEDFEILVVDDGSTDLTSSGVQTIDDARIRYFYQENAGRSAARNRGLRAARGEYVAFLDDDDLYLSHKLACQVDFLQQREDVDLVASGAEVIDEQGRPRGEIRGWLTQPQLILRRCIYACPLPTCTVLLRRRTLGRLDLWFDVAMDHAEDTDFFLRLLLDGCRMAWLPEVVSVYRIHPANSQQDGARYKEAYQMILDKLLVRPGVPDWIRLQQDQLYARCRVMGACQEYQSGQWRQAGDDLTAAVKQDPALLEDDPPALIDAIAGFAGGFRVEDSAAFISGVFDHLPNSLTGLRRWRRRTLSMVYMKRVFQAHAAGERPSGWDWLRGVYNGPYWLRNRGVWAILLRDILGLRVQVSGA